MRERRNGIWTEMVRERERAGKTDRVRKDRLGSRWRDLKELGGGVVESERERKRNKKGQEEGKRERKMERVRCRGRE